MQNSISDLIKGYVAGLTSRVLSPYFARITQGGGIYEVPQCVESALNSQNVLNNASFILIPSGYKGGTLYSELPINGNGDLTWTRGSDAFRTNASGVIQRVPWNLVQQSETFENAIWLKYGTGTLISNTTTAPNGTTTADKFIPNGANTQHACEQNMGTTSGAIVMSLYAKADGYNWLCFNAYVGGNKLTWFNISTGTIGTVASGVSASIENAGNGWYRCIVSLTGGASTYFSIIPSNANNVTVFAGDGTSGILLWGAQVVEGTTAQTYLPTTDRLNFPRLSYMYGSCPSVLLEPQRTNLALWSDDFSNSAWTKDNATITVNNTTSPDGTTNADKLAMSLGGTRATYMYRGFNATSGTTYTVSIYAKKLDFNFVAIQFTNINGTFSQQEAYFNINNGTLGTLNGSITATIVSIGDGWFRCTATATALATALGVISFSINSSNNVIAVTGTSGQGNYFWGAQFEQGAYPTTYIPTTSATATRVADSFSRNNIYTNGLISASGGTWFVELRNNVVYVRDNPGALYIGTNSIDANAGNGLLLRNPGGSTRILIRKVISGVGTDLYQTVTDTIKVAIKWNGTSADVFVNGTKQVSGTSFTTTNMEFLNLNAIPVPYFIQQMALFPTPISDTDCELLTGTAYSSYESMATALGYYVI